MDPLKKGRPFVMLHCWALLQHHQKWLKRKDEAPPKRQKSTNSIEFAGVEDIDEDGVQNEDGRGRSPTPCSTGPTDKRPPGRKASKEKLKKGSDSGIYKEMFQEMITTRKEKKQENETRWMEVKAMEERKATIEERKATIEERKVAIEEEKLRIMSEKAMNKKLEQEQKIMFMDSSCLDDDQKAYVSAVRAQILTARIGTFVGGTSGGVTGSSC